MNFSELLSCAFISLQNDTSETNMKMNLRIKKLPKLDLSENCIADQEHDSEFFVNLIDQILLMRNILVAILFALPFSGLSQQKANYTLAARFSPKKLDKMIFSLAVDPHWLKTSNRFWYTFETSEGKQWMIVDPVKMEKKTMFNRDKIAAELTKIIKDPFDGQHLTNRLTQIHQR